MALEKMDEFFDARLDVYDSHMLADIESAKEFYPETARVLPSGMKSLLDLGAGTGLELEEIFRLNDTVSVTAVDLAPGMLSELKRKFADKGARLDARLGSYFELPFGENSYDAAVSVESLHHFSVAQKTALYKKLFAALKPGGVFVLTDYFAKDDAYEKMLRDEYARLLTDRKAEDGYFHFDLPLTVPHEKAVLEAAGFCVTVHRSYGATSILICEKGGCR